MHRLVGQKRAACFRAKGNLGLPSFAIPSTFHGLGGSFVPITPAASESNSFRVCMRYGPGVSAANNVSNPKRWGSTSAIPRQYIISRWPYRRSSTSSGVFAHGGMPPLSPHPEADLRVVEKPINTQGSWLCNVKPCLLPRYPRSGICCRTDRGTVSIATFRSLVAPSFAAVCYRSADRDHSGNVQCAQ